MFKNIFKSKVAIVSVFTFLLAAIGFLSTLQNWSWFIPNSILVYIVGILVLLTEGVAYFFPSGGVFIGTGKDWTVPKYIASIGIVAIAFIQSIVQAPEVVSMFSQDVIIFLSGTVIACLQLIVRIFGGDTPQQLGKRAKIAAAKTSL